MQGEVTLIVLPCSPGKYFQESEIPLVFFGGVWGAEGLDGWGLEELGVEVCLGVGSGIGDEVCDESGR